jgi:alpha-glucosidase
MRRIREPGRTALFAFSLLVLVSCGDDNDGAMPTTTPQPTATRTPAPADTATAVPDTPTSSATPAATPTGTPTTAPTLPGFALSDGTRLVVGDAGGVSLFDGERRMLSTPDGIGPRLHDFTETVRAAAGLWVFGREDETVTALDRFRGASGTADGVELRWASAAGTAAATLAISPDGSGEATRFHLEVQAAKTPTSIAFPVRCEPDGGFYGFGEQYNQTDQRGEAFTLFVSEQGIGRDPDKPVLIINGGPHTTYFPMPYYLDPRGFGVLVQTARRVEVDLCRGDAEVAWLEVISGQPLDLLVFHGPKPLDVIRQLGARIGRPKQPPAWAYDPWIGAQGGRDAVLAKAAALRALDIPAGVLWVQDWTGVRMNIGGGFGVQYRWTADEMHYPDLAGMIADLRREGFRFLGYVNPFVDVKLGHFPVMDENGWLIENAAGESYVHFAPNGMSSEPDVTQEAARDYVKGFLRAMVTDYGMDGWMSDFGEWTPIDAVYASGVNPVAEHDLFPIAWMRMSREVMDELRPDGDWVVFSRSGWTGIQSVSMIHWCGDQETSFDRNDGLPTVIPAMLNLGISGVPYVAHDIAGFSSMTVPPSTKELYLRWTELGALTPIMRTHEGNQRLLNWSWDKDEETTALFRRYARIHRALASDFRALADEAAQTSAPIVRHLILNFPDDPGSRGISDEYMIGDSLLVAPVIEEGATARALYLPPGVWYDVWTGTRYEGGRDIEVPAPLDTIPVFNRGADRTDLREIE